MLSNNRAVKAFTLVELLVAVLILGIIIAVALPSYLSSVQNSRATTANSNAKIVATAIQSNYERLGGNSYTAVEAVGGGAGTAATAAQLAGDMGGTVPMNPCTNANVLGTDYLITSNDAGATGMTITAATSANCGNAAMYQNALGKG